MQVILPKFQLQGSRYNLFNAMTGVRQELNCPFCRVPENAVALFSTSIPKAIIRYQYAILFENNAFTIVPDISPLCEFHVLILTKKHYLSFSEIPPEQESSLGECKDFLNKRLGSTERKELIYFEHGSCGGETGACIAHAHLHCVPLSKLESNEFFEKVSRYVDNESPSLAGESYLQVQFPNGQTFKWADDLHEKQFFRKILTTILKKPARSKWRQPFTDDNEIMLSKVWIESCLKRFKTH